MNLPEDSHPAVSSRESEPSLEEARPYQSPASVSQPRKRSSFILVACVAFAAIAAAVWLSAARTLRTESDLLNDHILGFGEERAGPPDLLLPDEVIAVPEAENAAE